MLASPVQRTRPPLSGEIVTMLHNGSSACLQGPHLPVRMLRSRPAAARKGLCQPGTVSRLADPTIRYDLVARVRKEIAAGTYDTPEKMDAALERLLDRFDLA